MDLRVITTTFFLLLFIPALACLNETRVLIDGRKDVFDSESPVPHGQDLQANKADYEEELKDLYRQWKTERKINDYSDYGVLLVYLGRYAEAEKVFLEIEKRSPGLYSTAANLGTTYELLGQNKLALRWITKAVRINATAHDGSEWLHVKILEAKIGGEKLITSKFLIGAGFGSEVIPKTQLDSSSLIKLRDAVYYQLDERVSFVKPKDKIVALLLFELGNICALTDDVTSTLRVYERAKAYGHESDLLNRRYAHFLKMQAGVDNEYSRKAVIGSTQHSLTERNSTLLAIAGVASLLIIGLLIFRRAMRQ